MDALDGLTIDWPATERAWDAHRLAVFITAAWWGWGFARTVRYYEQEAVGFAVARPAPDDHDEPCPLDPDGLHFAGCGCDYTNPDDGGA